MNDFRRNKLVLVGAWVTVALIAGFASSPIYATSYQFTTINVPGTPSEDMAGAGGGGAQRQRASAGMGAKFKWTVNSTCSRRI